MMEATLVGAGGEGQLLTTSMPLMMANNNGTVYSNAVVNVVTESGVITTAAITPTAQGIILTSADGGTLFVNTSEATVLAASQDSLTATSYDAEEKLTQVNGPTIMTVNNCQEIKPPVGKGPFPCELCDRKFQKWNQLQRHLRFHANDKPHRCVQCSMSFNVESNLILHKSTHAPDDPTCPECDKRFSRVASLKAHIMLHEKEENLMCTECGDEFSLQSQLDKHMLEHREEESGNKTFSCKQCTQDFNKTSLLREHMKVHYRIRSSLSHRTRKHNIDRTGFHHRCDICEKTFQKPSQLERHIRIHTGERPFRCPQCDKAFNQKGALQIHMTKHSGQRPHICDFCPAAFSQKGNLRAHIQRVHTLAKNSELPTYQCEECSCVFRKLGSLNAHMSRMHTDNPDSQESLSDVNRSDSDCQQKNVTNAIQQIIELSNMGNNTDSSHNQMQQLTVEGAISSDILQQALENSGLTTTQVGIAHSSKVDNLGEKNSDSPLNPHSTSPVHRASSQDNVTTSTMTIADTATGTMKKHIIRKVGGVRWHQCTYCSKEFKKPSDLVRHIRIHTHEKPYKCNQCFRAFAVKSTLTAHVRTHSGLKEFRCHVCDKLFSTQGSLKVHLRLHTGAKPFDCPQCEKRFRTSGHRKSHMLSHFKDNSSRKPRRTIKKNPKSDISIPDIPLQEPILITDNGLVQQAPRNSSLFTQFMEEASSMDRPYKCTYCSRGFKKSSHLKQHIRSHTGEKPYKCLQCLRSFVSSGVLKAHIRTHSGIKAYKCLICDSTFTTNGSLKRHMSTHSEMRPFMCPYCQKTFKTSVNCKKHMKTHRHELAMQAAQTTSSTNDNGAVSSDNEQELAQQTVSFQQQNLTQEALSTQNFTQDSLTQENLQQLQQTISQQVYDQQTALEPQNLNQSTAYDQEANSFNQTFGQFTATAFTQNQFTLPSDQLQNTIDVATLNSSFNQTTQSMATTLTSTSMQNILQTREPRIRHSTLHQQELEDGKRTYKCTYCEKAFKKSSHLKQHIRSHTGEKPYKCNQCGRMFVSTGVLKAHLRTHTGQKDYKCSICHATFTTNGSLTRHMMIHSSIRPFKCVYCSETFRTSIHCRRHMKAHRDGGIEELEKQPSRRTRSAIIQISEEQAAELAKQVPETDTTVSEKILIASAAEKDRVSEIKDKHAELEKLPKHAHQCIHCPKSFKKPSDLVRHIRIHTGEKPFVCEICTKSFTVKSTLDSHLKTHTGEKHFKCHVCSSLFATKGSLKVHMRLHTGAKPFKCPHCDLRFRTSGHRKSHITTHFKPTILKKRKIPTRSLDNSQIVSILHQTEQQLNNQSLAGQITIDQNMLQQNLVAQQNILPTVSLATDSFGNLTDSGIATQVLQSFDGIQLQITTSALGQGIQITGIDPSLLSQTVQIDANLLQQLQQQGNINVTINPNVITQSLQGSDHSLVSGTLQGDPLNTNVIVQPMTSLALTNQGQVVIQQDTSGTSDAYYERSNNRTLGENNIVNNSDSIHNLSLSQEDSANENVGDIDDSNQQSESGDEKIHVCHLCDKTFKTSHHLKEHLVMHVSPGGGLKQTPYKCHSCEKAFGRPSQLKRHIRIHTGERPFVCPQCNKAFNQKNALQLHQKNHSGERPHKCIYCDQAFTQKGNLKVHIKRAHYHDTIQSMNLPKRSEIVPRSLLSEKSQSDGQDEITHANEFERLVKMNDLLCDNI